MRRKALENARGKSGRFFNSLNCDIYSGIAVALTSEKYIYSRKPLSVNGASKHSTGSSSYGANGTTKQPMMKFFEEKNIEFHNDCVLAPSIPIVFYECLVQARDALGIDINEYGADMRSMLYFAWRKARGADSEKKQQIAQAINQMAERNRIAISVPELRGNGAVVRGKGREIFPTIGLFPMRLNLDGENFHLENIFDACRLCENTMTLWDLKGVLPGRMCAKIASRLRR